MSLCWYRQTERQYWERQRPFLHTWPCKYLNRTRALPARAERCSGDKDLVWATSSICLEVDISNRENSGSRLHVQVLLRIDIAGHLGGSCIPARCGGVPLHSFTPGRCSPGPYSSHHSSFRSHWGPRYSPPSIPRPLQCDCGFFHQEVGAISPPLESYQCLITYLGSQNGEEMKACQFLLQACLFASLKPFQPP